ncbi:DUF992 domain-containing protein [Rhodobacteraceae bacterium RKSG542]|nr:DUF992 domain-containing protein [Pseudovibrio flavus]
MLAAPALAAQPAKPAAQPAAPAATAQPAAPATNENRPTVEIGTLTCKIEGGSTFIIGSSHALGCDFKNANGKSQPYTGKITSFGLDIGTVKSGTLVWGVLAPAANMKPGALAGKYAGVSAGAALGAGVQANVLLGGFNRSIALQPVSLQSQTGINLTAGVTGLTLER